MPACEACGGSFHVRRIETPSGEEQALCFDCREQREAPLRGAF